MRVRRYRSVTIPYDIYNLIPDPHSRPGKILPPAVYRLRVNVPTEDPQELVDNESPNEVFLIFFLFLVWVFGMSRYYQQVVYSIR